MPLQNISRAQTLKILSEAPLKGSYSVPSALHDLPITKADLCVAVALLKLEVGFRKEAGRETRCFYAKVNLIAKNARCSPSAVRRSLARLEFIGLIQYQTGSWQQRRATKVTILIDNFYLADEVLISNAYKSNSNKQEQEQHSTCKDNSYQQPNKPRAFNVYE